MLRYKNTSVAAKTFYGTTFNPGEEKDVPGYINDPKMVRVASKPKELPKAIIKKTPAPAAKPAESKPSKEQIKQGGELDGSDNNK